MAQGVSTEISVSYRERDGWHLFDCDELPGLFVASQDRRRAFADLPDAIRMLLKLDYKRDVVVSHKLTYAEFVERNWLTQRAQSEVRSRTARLIEDGAEHIPFIIGPSVDCAGMRQ